MANTKSSAQTLLRGIVDDAQRMIDLGVRSGDLTKAQARDLRARALSRITNALHNANESIQDEIARAKQGRQ